MPLYIQLLHVALTEELSVILPILGLLLAVGLLTAILQASLQIEDAGFSLLPKVIIMMGLPVLGGIGALHGIEALATLWITHAGQLVHRSWS
ncbi:flagellar biosynthetic protein FliQ [Acidocella sp.]|jgi:flagellar biosynthesis protein FliQ|uniref:flagellar biosynthetic protein FliQ n=1 Tax=Acidocella sp. TaxID=50710 RepID=UPI002F42FA77